MLVLASASTAQGQIAAGTMMLGGSVGYIQQSTEGAVGNTNEKLSELWQFNVSPTAAYFLVDNLAVGLNLGYSGSTGTLYNYIRAVPIGGTGSGVTVLQDVSELRSYNLRVGPIARYYQFVGEKAALFGQLGGGYQANRMEGETTSADPLYVSSELVTGGGFFAQLMPGFAFFPTHKLALEVTLGGFGYQRQTQKATFTQPAMVPASNVREYTASSFGASFGLSSLQLGAVFYLGRK
ncbi:hypothetical protein GCM10023185_10510 [Hymenobacter saemangeumensis]|uniref:Outer membrane protein beta-barrel domain-containing protein n=2 Tax=Hymenobacter saemangeumensis TaxID=1084522 RepID=A0ABP8I563_9BACT